MTHAAWRRAILVGGAVILAWASGGSAVRAAKPAPRPSEGEQLIIRQDWEAAEEYYYDRYKADPNDPEVLRKLGFIELRRPGGDAVRARKYLEKARSLDPENPVGLFLLGRTYDALGLRDLAVRTYDELIALGPGRDEPQRASAVHLARFARALAAIEQGDAARAQELLDEVLRREKHHAYVFYEKALLAAGAGRTDEAIDLYRRTLEALDRWAPTESWPYPSSRYAYIRENVTYDLARLLLEKGEAEEAVRLLEPVVEQVRMRNKLPKRAIAPEAKSPLEGEPDVRYENAPLVYGKALAALGRRKEARKVLKEFARMHVGDPDARSRARRLSRELK